jgi:hypothetical protein
MKGFKFFQPETNWFAYYSDFDQPMPLDEAYLRNAYHGSVEAIAKNGKRLLAQRDVFLNKRLGTEFVIARPSLVSYMRSFIFGSRAYTLAVDRKTDVGSDATFPSDVQQFFDSFTYWE